MAAGAAEESVENPEEKDQEEPLLTPTSAMSARGETRLHFRHLGLLGPWDT